MEPPVWTKTPPTKPGLYWFVLGHHEQPDGVQRFCQVVDDPFGKGLTLGSANYDDAGRFLRVERLQRWWAGPLLEPVEVRGEQCRED